MWVLASETNGSGSASEEWKGNTPLDVCHKTYWCHQHSGPPSEARHWWSRFALRRKCLRWFGHVQRSTSWIGRVCSLDVGGRRSCGRPIKTWCEVLRNDLKLSGLRMEDAENCALWRSKTKTMQYHIRKLSGSVTLMASEWVSVFSWGTIPRMVSSALLDASLSSCTDHSFSVY